MIYYYICSTMYGAHNYPSMISTFHEIYIYINGKINGFTLISSSFMVEVCD